MSFEMNEQQAGGDIQNSIDKMGGSGNYIVQASTVVYNIVLNDFLDGSSEKLFKSLPGIRSENSPEDEENIDLREDDDIARDGNNSTEEKLTEEIVASSNDLLLTNTPQMKGTGKTRKVPQTHKEIEKWYYQELHEKERCFVNACAILHGATWRSITEATRAFFTPLQERSQRSTHPLSIEPDPPPAWLREDMAEAYTLGQQAVHTRIAGIAMGSEVDVSSLSIADTFPAGSITSLLERTFTVTERFNGASRVFWQDTKDGFSLFSMELLAFLSQEAAVGEMFDAQPERHFLDIVQQWPTRYKGEMSWRSARALGILWWHLDARNLLWRQADKWVKSSSRQDWYLAASLLEGAYQAECKYLNSPISMEDSSVLQLLGKWTALAHQTTTRRGEGYAAARTYTLIGRISPEVALQGLKRLLNFPSVSRTIPQGGRDPREDLFLSAVVRYVDIAKAGHVRPILKHLATSAQKYMNDQCFLRMRDQKMQQSITDLHTTLTAFLLLTSCSLAAVDGSTPAYSPTERLLERPVFPDKEGRDVLLAGLLTTGEPGWQDQIAALLCAMIADKDHQAAFYLLRRWGEIISKDNSANAVVLQDSYAQFLVKVGQLIVHMAEDPRQSRIGVYRRQLTFWLTNRKVPQPSFKRLAQRVLDQLPSITL